jgi:hypothetical protein
LKEVRALLPTSAAGLAAIGAAFLSDDDRVLALSALGYGVAALALGALSVGHEYANRTIGLLLVQPLERWRMFLIKLLVLLFLLCVLGAAAWYAPFNEETWRRPWSWQHPAVVLLPVVIGFFIAPWMTMLCRSTLAGIVFAATLPGLPIFAGEVIGAMRLGVGHPDVDTFRDQLWLRAILPILAAAAALGWRAFSRLDAIDGAGSDIQMPRWFKAERPARRHPFWLLFWKELHLQQMTFVIVVLFAIGWATLSLLKDLVPAFADAPLVPVTMIYLVLLSILIGSLASAEERQLGVLQWQGLLPMHAWQQFAVKAGTALSLALALGAGLPILLDYLGPAPDQFEARLWRREVVMVIALTSLSLYISSLTTSGVRAVMISFPVLMAVAVSAHLLHATLFIPATAMTIDGSRGVVRRLTLHSDVFSLTVVGMWVLLALWLAFRNHGSAEREFRRISLQILCFLAVPLGALVIIAGLVVGRIVLEG